jgi:hypothetical protein
MTCPTNVCVGYPSASGQVVGMERLYNMRLHAPVARLVAAFVAVVFAAALAIALGVPPPKEDPPPGFAVAIKCPPDGPLAVVPRSHVPGPEC